MKESFQINSVNLDSGIVKEAFSQESLATSIEGNTNVMSHSLEHLHFPHICTLLQTEKISYVNLAINWINLG